MRIFWIPIFLLLILATAAYSQDSVFVCKPAVVRWSMSVAQSALDDLTKGESVNIEFDNYFELVDTMGYSDLRAMFDIKTDLGFVLLSDKKLMKEFVIPRNNLFYTEGKLKYTIGWQVDPFFSASFKTQIVTAYKLKVDDYVKSADFWDPVESQETWGFEYCLKKPEFNLVSNIGVSLKQIRSHLYNTLTDDYKTPKVVERYKAETGIN